MGFIIYTHQDCSQVSLEFDHMQVGAIGSLLKDAEEAEHALGDFAKFLGAYNIR